MASNNVINTEFVGSIVCGLKFISRLMRKHYVEKEKKNVLTLSEVYFLNKIV